MRAAEPQRHPGLRSVLQSNLLLKACIFATGLAGIVAEYVMATLASYLLGNAVLQWSLTISLMLFAMGVGSRLSKRIDRHLLDAFIATELLLSLLTAGGALLAYALASLFPGSGLVIYTVSFSIGLLIGIELPLITRLNDTFEEIEINVASVLEADYYGALLGGLLFALVALPTLGLTYTPVVLAAVNALVAAALYLRTRKALTWRRTLTLGVGVVPIMILGLALAAKPIVLYGEQQKYRDKVIYQEQTSYQRIVITEWRGHHWLYLDGHLQFSSFDEYRYHEPLVHPAMLASPSRRQVLVLGGGDGVAVREVLKYPEVEGVTLVDIDPAMTRLAGEHPALLGVNQGALFDPRVEVVNEDAYRFLETSRDLFDVIILDFPDPKTVSLARLYSLEFYRLVWRQLAPGGVMATQATSPLFSRRAFLAIDKTVSAAGFTTAALHNHILSMGEWGWVLGVKTPKPLADNMDLKRGLEQLDFSGLETTFLDQTAMRNLLAFGKDTFSGHESIRINRQLDLSLYFYYRDRTWELY